MKKYLFVFSFLILYSCGNGKLEEAEQELVHPKNISEQQVSLIEEKVKVLPDQAQLAIAIIKNGAVSFYGIKRENDATLISNNARQVFEIGSITKVFTGALLANYLIDQKIALEDDINDFLNFPLKEGVRISFKQLATHTAGLPRVPASLDSVSLENPYKGFVPERLKIYLTEKLKMIHEPGEICDYSNLGFGLLGFVLGEITDKTYEEMLQEKIFSKYGMDHSTTNRKALESRLVKGLNDEGEAVSNWDMAAFVGAGGILSTVEDLSKFALAQFDPLDEALELTRKPSFKVNENYSMGLAWGLIITKSGAEWNWHNGGTGGYTSSMIIDTKAKNGVIILSNISGVGQLTGNITDLCPALMNTLY